MRGKQKGNAKTVHKKSLDMLRWPYLMNYH